MDKINQSFPDPSEFSKREDWDYAAMVASVYKKVGAEFINWLESNRGIVEHLRKKEKGEVKDTFQIGT